jgi:hypothetical protein
MNNFLPSFFLEMNTGSEFDDEDEDEKIARLKRKFDKVL